MAKTVKKGNPGLGNSFPGAGLPGKGLEKVGHFDFFWNQTLFHGHLPESVNYVSYGYVPGTAAGAGVA